jgi:hypothetical protein
MLERVVHLNGARDLGGEPIVDGRQPRRRSMFRSDCGTGSTIQAATNNSESFNEFVQWLAIGGAVIAENDRVEQRKVIKYKPPARRLPDVPQRLDDEPRPPPIARPV